MKQQLHGLLQALERITPARVRAAVRKPYLRHVYYPLYPEKRPSTPAHSSFPPLLDFKRRLTGGLPLHFERLRVHSVPGRVSVVLPVYNGARYVRDSIESVLGQTYRNLELVIVDDGSEDETPRLLEQAYAGQPRVRLIRQANRGLPAALSAGFAAAQGEYFTWTSDDNLMHPGMLAELAGFLERDPDTEMVFANEQLIDENGAPALESGFCPHFQRPPGGDVLDWPRDPGPLNFIQENFIGGAFLYRAWVGRILGAYDEACFGFEDYDYWMRMNALFRIRHLGSEAPLYRYRIHPRSLSARNRELRIFERVRDFMPVEAERRRFFLEPFEISFHGEHPWFAALREAWRRAGHTMVAEGCGPGAKRLRLVACGGVREAAGGPPPQPGEFRVGLLAAAGGLPESLASFDWIVATTDAAFEKAGPVAAAKMLAARTPSSVLYPLLAAANSRLWRCPA